VPANQGPSRWKRLLYSIVCVPLGVLLFSFFFVLADQIWGMPHFDFGLLLSETFDFGYFAFLFSLPGWFIALSFVLTVTDFSRWRLLAFWAIGTATGPLAMLATAYVILVADTHKFGFSPPPGFLPSNWIAYAASIACLVTFLYLLLVRYDQRRTRLRRASNAAQSDPTTHNS
jgi:hypothetical protein